MRECASSLSTNASHFRDAFFNFVLVAIPTVFFFSWMFILEPGIFTLDPNGFHHNESNASSAEIDLSVTVGVLMAM